MKNTIWITGAEGKLGSELVGRLSADVGNKIIGTDIDVDITDSKAVLQHAEVYRPTVIINCASISNAEYCEAHMVEAFKVNALGARNLATAARHVNAKIIQLSTDDIFAGNNQQIGMTEYDISLPNTVYGKSKLAGENYVRELNPKHLIVRSSWVYGFGKDDYFSYVYEKGQSGTPFEAAVDNISSPTSAKGLANLINSLIEQSEYGIYHASSEGSCTRAEFAKAILAKTGMDTSLVKEVKKNEEGVVTSTLLENLMLKMTGIYEMRDWEAGLDDFVSTLKK